MEEIISIESCRHGGTLAYVITLSFSDTGATIMQWRCKRLKHAWETAREVNRLLKEGDE